MKVWKALASKSSVVALPLYRKFHYAHQEAQSRTHYPREKYFQNLYKKIIKVETL